MSKEGVVKILDDYNSRMEQAGKDEQVITYTDVVGTLMSSVSDIIDVISYVLIAFVAISLVVSSIMIGVITYISVLERKKKSVFCVLSEHQRGIYPRYLMQKPLLSAFARE